MIDGRKETERKKQNIHTVIIPDMHGRSYFNTKQVEGAEDREFYMYCSNMYHVGPVGMMN